MSNEQVVELTWSQILERGFVYGIPSFFNGKFTENTPNRDKKSIQRGVLHRFPSTLCQKFDYLDERSRCTSGIRVEFMTDAHSLQIHSKVNHLKHRENFSNLSQAGIDILVDGKFWGQHCLKWDNSDRIYLPNTSSDNYRITLVFPNYAGIKLHKLVLENVTQIQPRSPEYLLNNRPIVYYGSSITQGACASRPALAYPHQLSETFSINYVNLGISGNARGEPEMAKYIASFKNAALFVLDWGANLLDEQWGDTLERRYETFWRIIHKANPTTPILFIGLQNFAYDVISESGIRARIQYKRDFVQDQALAACEEINQNNGGKYFDYIDGTSIINTSNLDKTVDGTHPNDMGMKTYAELLEWKIIDLLGNHVKN